MDAVTPVADSVRDPSSLRGAAGIWNEPALSGKISAHERRQAAIAALGRDVSAGVESSRFSRDAAILLGETIEADGAGVALLDHEQGMIAYYPALLDGKAVSDDQSACRLPRERDQSAPGYALSRGGIVAVEDLGQETRFRDEFLRRQGAQSVLACPLLFQDESRGALVAFRRQRRPFDESDVRFAETIASLITVSLVREQAARSLERQRKFATSLLETVDSLVLVLRPDGIVRFANSACEKMTGFPVSELTGRTIWEALAVPQELSTMQRMFARTEGGKDVVRFEASILAKAADRRRLAWSCRALCDDAGAVESILAVANDVTVLHELREKLLRQEKFRSSKILPTTEAAGRTAPGGVRETDSPLDDDEDWELAAAVFAEQAETPIAADRRTRSRHEFPYVQLIAPVTNDCLPARSAFREVDCRDISSGGFSFYAKQPPVDEYMVVALGAGRGLTFVIAQVKHINRISHNGEPMFLIGCRYVGRTHYD